MTAPRASDPKAPPKAPKTPKAEDPRRQRIQAAAWDILLEAGPEHLSTAELARRAGVSKREIYGLFGNKSALLADCVAARTQEMRRPLAAPPKLDGAALEIKQAKQLPSSD